MFFAYLFSIDNHLIKHKSSYKVHSDFFHKTLCPRTFVTTLVFIRHVHILNLSRMYTTVVEIHVMVGKWISHFFSIFSRGITLSKSIWPEPNWKLNLYIWKTNLYIKFKLNMCNGCWDNDQRVNFPIFSKFKRLHSVKKSSDQNRTQHLFL